MSGAVGQEKVIRIVVDENALRGSVANANSILSQIGQGGNLGNLNSQFGQLSAAAANAARGISAANDNLHGTAAAAGRASGGILSMIGHLGTMTLALAGIGFLTAGVHELAHAFIEAADEATMVTSRVMSFATSTREAAEAQASIASIATQTRQPLENISELYQKTSLAGEALGISQNEAGVATKVFAETLKLSGSNVAQQKGAILQLADAFDIGKLQGRHFMAMMMDNVVFMNMLAQSMGVSKAKLGELAHEGKITGETLKNALTDPKMVAEIEARFGKIPVSFADVRTAIKNTLIQLAGDFMTGAGINESLATLYAKISAWGTSAKDTFIKIGEAFKAAVSTFAPLFTAAFDAIKPLFAFILNNAPTIIQLVKVAAETWIAYRIAIAGVAAVNLAKTFLVSAQSLAMFLDLAKGGSGVMGIFKASLTLVAGGFEALTAVIAANPLGALVIGITAVIGLLYEFRDSINLGGGTMASFGDLMRAVWESVGPSIQRAMGWIGDGFSWIGDKVSSVMSFVAGIFGDTFSGFDFSIAGAIRAAARFADFMIGNFTFIWQTIKTIWNNFPAYLQMIFASAANMALAKVEDLANGVIGAINSVIKGAQSLGININTIANVKLGRVDAGSFQEQLANATKGAYGHAASDSAEGLLARAGQIGARRRAQAAAGAQPGATPHAPAGDDGADGKKDKKAEERAKREKEFWQTLQDELTTAGLYGIKLAEFTEEKKLHKILERDLTASEKLRVDTIIDEIANTKAVTTLKLATFELENRNLLLRQRSNRLTVEQSALEDALDAKRLEALNTGADINSTDYKTWLAKYRVQLETNQALVKQSELLKQAADFAKKYGASFSAQSELTEMAKERDAFLKAFGSGNLKDAIGNPMSDATRDGILAGYDAAALAIRNRPLQVIADFTGKGSLASQQLGISKADSDYTNAKAALASLDIPSETRAKIAKEIEQAHVTALATASREVADKFVADFTDGIDQLANIFGGKFGDILNSLSGLMKNLQAASDPNGGLSKLANLVSSSFGSGFQNATNSMTLTPQNLKDGLSNLSDPLGALVKGFDPSQGGSFLKGMGAAVGGAIQGSQIGAAIGGIGDALGIKGFSKGANIGGTLGGLTGNPIIAAAASVVGGIIGALFYKPPSSNATFTKDAKGNVVVGAVSGSNASLKQATSGAAGEVLTGLQNIAQQLGGKLTGIPNLTIGTWNDKWRVLDNQQTTAPLHSKNFSMGQNLHDFGSDEASAVAYAIKEALTQGVITGLPDVVQKALRVLDSDSAIAFAQQWANVISDFTSITDPIGAAVKAITEPLSTLRQTMVQVGASTEDLNKIDEYRTLKLKEALKQQLQTVTDFMKTLNGDGSGVSDLSRLTTDLAAFKDYQTKIAAGDSTINQQDFANLGNEIFSLAGNVYGTSTSQFQDVRSMLTSATQGLSDNVTKTFNDTAASTDPVAVDATTAAINAQTQAIVGQQAITNSLLAQLVANGGVYGGGFSPAFVDKLNTANGLVLDNLY